MFYCVDCIGCYWLASSIVKIMIQYNLKKKVKRYIIDIVFSLTKIIRSFLWHSIYL